MELSFLKLLNTSISASWLILVVIVLRLVLKKAPKSIHCLLWALVAIRLVCPFSIESIFSLVPSAETVPEMYLTLEGETRQYGTVLEVVGNSLYPQSDVQVVGNSIDRVQVQDVFLTLGWLVGVGVLALYALVSYLRIRHKVAPAVRLRENIWVCDYIDTPFILGLFRPRIYLPSSLGGAELVHVLSHERAHLKRKDHWWKPLGFLLLTVYWFNPLIWVAYILLCRDIEMACDERVIRDLGAEEKKAYSAALLNCSVKRHMIAACPLAFGEVGVKARVKSVLNYKKPAFWIIVIAVVLSVVVAVCFLTDPVERATPAAVFETLTAEDVRWAQATFWLDEGSEHLMLTEDQTAELVGLLKAVEDGAYVEKHIDHDLSVMLNCGEQEILLQWDGSFVTFSWDSDTAELLENVVWGVQDEELNRFLESLELPQQESGPAEVLTEVGIGNIAISLPEGWAYEEIPYDDANRSFGMAFWPEGVSEGRVELRHYDQLFGVCGTGLETVPGKTVNGYGVTFGYYDGSDIWSYMSYEGVPGCYVATTSQVDSWWEEYSYQVEQILGTARLCNGFADESYILATAREAMRETEKAVVESLEPKLAAISSTPSYMVTFDNTNQIWRVGMYMLWDSSPRAEVYLDVYGNVLDWEDWGIVLSAEEVTANGLALVCWQSGSVPGDKTTALGPYQAQLMTGSRFWLEKLVDGVWETVPTLQEEVVWTTEGWLVSRNDTTTWNVNWTNLYGKLDSGTYRIGKNFSMSNYLADSENQNYYASFRILDVNLGTATVNLGTATVEYSVEGLLDTICSAPLESSAPGAYIESHLEGYGMLLEYPEQTLRYCFDRFLSGGQTDLRGHIMAAACK